MLKVGVVGMGFMGLMHASIFKTLDGVVLEGLVEVDTSRHAELKKQFGVDVYGRIEDLLPKVDAVSICTPDQLHKEPILAAFRSGVKVLVEKPLTTTSIESQEIIDKRPDPSFLMVGHILHFDPRVIQCKQVIDSGKLGNIWFVKIWRHNNLQSGVTIGKRTSVTWYLGVHDIELLLYLTGQHIKQVSAAGRKLFTPYWDLVHAQVHMENGLMATVENSWIYADQRPTGLDAGIKIIGDKGMIEVNLSHADIQLSTAAAGRMVNLDTYNWPKEEQVPQGNLRKELQAFAAAAAAGMVPPITGEQAMEAVQAVEAVERSLETGLPQLL